MSARAFSHLYPEVLQNAVNGDRAAFLRLLGTYQRISPPMLTRLEQAIASGDIKAIAAESHTLKGTAALVGALELAALLEQIEHAAKRGGQVPQTGLLAQVQAEFHAVAEEVRVTMAAPTDL